MVKLLKAEKMIAHVIFGILLFFEGLSKREHCHHKVLYVEDITQYTALLHWESGHTKGVEDYKVLCAGVRQYITVEGDREVDLDTVTQFVPQGVGRAFLGNLQSNFNYSCVVQAEDDTQMVQETRPLFFSTLYSVPEVLKPPVIAFYGKQISIQLFPTSTKYGPLDGYEVQFHILDKDTAHVHGQPVLPKELTQPRGLLASIEAARSSMHPIPFCIAFRNGSLPSHINESFMQGAMRSGTTYFVITVAYTDNYEEISRPLLYTLSPPSMTVTSGNVHSECRSQSTLSWLERQVTKSSMAVGVVVSNLIILYFLVIGCCILCVEMRGSSQERLLSDKRDIPLTTQQSSVMLRKHRADVVSHPSSVRTEPAGENSSSEREKYLCREKSSTSSAQAAGSCVVTERSDELTDGMPITEGADSVSGFVIRALDTSSVTEELGSPRDNLQESSKKHVLQPVIQLGISGILKKATRSIVSLQSSAQSGWSSSSKGAGQDDTGAICHDVQSVNDDEPVHFVRSEHLGATVSDHSHHSAPYSASDLHSAPHSAHDLSLVQHSARDLHSAPHSACDLHSAPHSARGLHSAPHCAHDLQSVSVGGELVRVQGATQWVEPSRSSLVFVPRGLSRGPWAPSNLPLPSSRHEDTPWPLNTSGADLAPDLEMDLYGISYSLDTPDHFQQ